MSAVDQSRPTTPVEALLAHAMLLLFDMDGLLIDSERAHQVRVCRFGG